MKISAENGIVLEKLLCIDPSNSREAGKNVFITHAHSDHARINGHNNYFMSKETHSLLKTRKINSSRIKELEQKKKEALDNAKISLHHSGHILGSSQVMIEAEKNYVVTSDFKLQDSLLFKGAEILPSDVLIIESTFGLPEYVFPEREAVYREITRWTKERIHKKNFVVLGGYSIGKAQELTRIVNEFLGEVPLVHETVFNSNKVYEENGVKLGPYLKLDHNLKESNVLIMPPQLISRDLVHALSISIGRKAEAAIATGWNYSFNGFKSFPLSDHSDFNQLMQYVKESNPKNVFTVHGFAEEFAHSVKRKLGINARPLSESAQCTLGEFD
ncbi:MAG: MBL fold metallo-hydrolase RNA specificity domain-containing protein [Candidatus Diapherotrites archaeon]